MDYFPIFLSLRGRRALVVGGGETAARKVRLLLKAEAAVALVAPHLVPELAELASAGRLDWRPRGFVAGDVDDAVIVFAASDDEVADNAVASAATAAAIPVNVVDRPAVSSFVVPAIVDRSPIVVGISSGGAAPVLARRVRAQIEALLPAGLGRLARFADSFRGAVKAKIDAPGDRRRLWESVFDGPIAADILAGSESRARERMVSLVNRPAEQPPKEGMVYIVGAGPGAPDLLTFKALRAMQSADVVVYDRLIGDEILDYVRRDAERIYVGKAAANHARSQDEINAILVEQARAGRIVVRLKGGDPFVFGRGGEEMTCLQAAGIPVEIVPGITAAVGCAAAAGLPLTHRDFAAGVNFVTGHGKSDREPELDWAALAASRQTIVVYMGVATSGAIAARLMAHGLDGATPVAVIENGTRPEQIVACGTVATLAETVRRRGIAGPALLVIGAVAALARESGVDRTLSPQTDAPAVPATAAV
jgi:uroporphyrin-III C-methyltransferase/precorrin-2 dehydrogenase/sirohydrochlorin ferrochelatase